MVVKEEPKEDSNSESPESVEGGEPTSLEKMARKERAFVRAMVGYGEACIAEATESGIDDEFDAVQCGSGQVVVAAFLYARSEIMAFLHKSGMRLGDATTKRVAGEALDYFVHNALIAAEASDEALASVLESSNSSDQRRRGLADVIRREESGDGIYHSRQWSAGSGITISRERKKVSE